MRIISLLCLSFLAITGFSQTNFNLELVANVEVPDVVNDIWGYQDEETGIEYAIMGTVNNTRVYSLEDYANPVEIANIPGSNTTWRDIKTWGDKAYVVCDNCPDGLLIIDFEDPTNLSWVFKDIPLTADSSEVHRDSHNIYIDENGFLYLAGGNYVDGVIIMDLNVDPSNPTVVGFEDFHYAHDVMVRGDTMWTSEINIGEFAAYDIRDKANPIYLGGVQTSSDFTHNAWISDDGKYLFTTDERPDAYVDSYDVSDLSNIKLLDKYRPLESEGNETIPHNTHYINGYLVTSWYTDGVVITDVSRPDNMVKVGGYDTFLGDHGGFKGCWGAYPWLPSGHILASDRQTGLYVLSPTYQRACYLEGEATNSVTGEAIFNATVTVLQDENLATRSDPTGKFASGRVTPGTVSVRVEHPNYYPFETEAELENGIVSYVDAQLLPIYIYRNDQEVFRKTGLTGDTITSVYLGEFKVIVSAWGYLNTVRDINFDGTDIVFEMERGYHDTFVSDQNWVESGDAELGKWERAKPISTILDGEFIAPPEDAPTDNANFAYVTDNGGGNPWLFDVDNGITTLKSDYMDLTWYNNPMIHFSTWFRNEGGGNTPNDMLTVSITNGTETALIYQTDQSILGWQEVNNLSLDGLLSINDKMQLIVETADDVDPNGNLVEAGFDDFLVTDGELSSSEDLGHSIDFKYFPNPAKDALVVQWHQDNSQLRIFDYAGKLVRTEKIQKGYTTLDIADLQVGYYTVQIVTESKVSTAKKLLKID